MHHNKAKAPAPKKKMSAGGTTEPDDSMVIILDDDSFQNHIDSHPATIVEFYAPWSVKTQIWVEIEKSL